jgi:dTDP-4-dehydrorhamnose reductase
VRLLVTGGAGYLGAEVVAQALAAGHDVTTTWLNHEPPAGRALRVDLADTAAVNTAFKDEAPDGVIHTAYRQAEEHVERDVVIATRNVAGAARDVGARLVHVSTDLVFDGERGAPYTEADEPHPGSAYGLAKLEAEHSVLGRQDESLVVRTSLLYGKEGGVQERLALRDDITFFVDEIRTPIHVADLADALLELIASDATGVLHLAGPEAVSRHEFARKLAAAQGRDPDELRSGPVPPGRARNVALDAARARALVATRIRAIDEALARA